MALLLFTISVAIGLTSGSSIISLKDPSRCGDWTPYKDEKCYKIVDTASHQTQQDAEIVCESFSAELNRESYPRLIRIKTKEEQEFLHHFLFDENKVADNVWLGLKQNETTKEFEWNDGTKVVYSNWAAQNVTDDRHKCVQMESGGGVYGTGQWVKFNCEKRVAVVCERTQTWTLETLQDFVLNTKLELERKIDFLERNPVPVGFVYVQLPGKEPPTTLWPQIKWKDVGSEYAGLFFRVEGGEAAPLGEIQDDHTRNLAQVYYNSFDNSASFTDAEIPSDGSWSLFARTGTTATATRSYGLRFRLTTGEIRPRNKAIKIWQRLN